MFNALLGSFVAWSLTAGALPGPWPAAASLALGGALLLLHGHTHGAALTVDVLARRSRFLTVNPGLKLWCCAALLALCLLARTPWPPLALFFAASALTAAGGVRPRAYLSLLGAPATFLLLSGIALLWEYASAPGGVANVPFLGGYFVLRVFSILVLAYSFWCPLILVPLAAAFLGVKSNGRAFRYALLAGLTSTLLWNYVLGKPWGVDGTMVGMLCNFLVFTACTTAYQRYDVQKIRVWK